jgi:hypothetical protein
MKRLSVIKPAMQSTIHTGLHRSTLLPQDPAVRRSLLFLALFQLLMWTAVPMSVHVSPSLDIVEGFAWGNAWQAGYFKHPPLSPWLTAVSTHLFGKNLFAVFVLSPLAILTALTFVWTLSREFFSERASAVGLYLVSSQLYFNLLTPEFNHNVMQIPLWAAAFALYWRAVTRGNIGYFIALGIVLGLCALAKYSAVLLYAVLAGFTIVRPDVWRKLKITHVLVCIASATVVAAPNMIWQVAHDFPSVKYADDRMGEKLSWLERLTQALKFLAAQAGMLLPIIVATLIAGRKAQSDLGLSPLARAYLITIAFGPALLVLPIILVGGNAVRTMWGMSMFTAIGLAALLWLGSQGVTRLFTRKWWIVWLIGSLVFLSLYAVMVRFGPLAKNRISRALYPGPQIAVEVEQEWRTRTNAPLSYVVGEVWMAGNVAFFADETPQVFIESNDRFSPWIEANRLAACGALLIWQHEPDKKSVPEWVRSYPAASEPKVKKFSVGGRPNLQVEVAWAIVPPQGQCPPR